MSQNSDNRATRRRLLKTTAVGLTSVLGTGGFGSAAAQESDDAPTVITEPITITESGTYVIEDDLKHDVRGEPDEYDYAPFIEVDWNGEFDGEVIIEGQGHEIAGHGYGSGVYGFEAYFDSFTVRDLTFRDFNYGINFEFGPTLDLENVTFTGCSGAGISGHLDAPIIGDNLTLTENGSGINVVHGSGTIADSTITDNDNNGIAMNDTDIENTTISRNGRGVYITLGNGATITNCTIQRNDEDGIESSDAYDVTVTDSNISHNGRHGINAYYADGWDINQNVINHNGEYGAYLDNFDSGRVIDNTIVGNDAGTIFLSDDAEGNVIEDNRTDEEGAPDRGNGDNNPSPPNGNNGNGKGKEMRNKNRGKKCRKKNQRRRKKHC